jgi:hypothetical protein
MSIQIKTDASGQFSVRFRDINFNENPSSGSRVSHVYRRTSRRGVAELTRKFAGYLMTLSEFKLYNVGW